MPQAAAVQGEGDALLLGAGLEEGVDLPQHLLQIALRLLHPGGAGQGGHLQKLVDHVQQLPAGRLHPLQIAGGLLRPAQVQLRQGGKAKNSLERGAHIV